MHIFDAYGRISELTNNNTVINGRYEFQENSEELIHKDIIEKLILDKSDSVLDIGCGSGQISYEISKIVNKVTLCDHPKTLERIKKLYGEETFNFIPGNFLVSDINHRNFDKILSYSVIQCLSSKNELFDFIDKILYLLAPSGRAMIGDIPNKSKLNRFLSSERGKIHFEDWKKNKEESGIYYTKVEDFISKDFIFIEFDDALLQELIMHIKRNNFEAYIYEQKSDLPFGNSREDLIINGKEFFL